MDCQKKVIGVQIPILMILGINMEHLVIVEVVRLQWLLWMLLWLRHIMLEVEMGL
jgi:hypothetical protein